MKKHNSSTLTFLKNAGRSLNPAKYKELSEYAPKNSIKFFLSLMVVFFILSVLIFLPKSGSYVEDKLDSLNNLKITLNTSSNDEIILFENSNLFSIKIDTRLSNVSEEDITTRYTITNEEIIKKNLLSSKTKVTKISDIANFKKNDTLLKSFALLLAPSVLFIFFVYLLFKTTFLVLIVWGIINLICKLTNFDIERLYSFNICIFATTPFILLKLIFFALPYNSYYSELFIYLIYVMIGVILTGEIGRSKKNKHREYVDFSSIKHKG